MKVNKNIYFKLVIANIIFFIFVLIMSVLINDNLNEATVDFDSKLYSLEKLDQITESQYDMFKRCEFSKDDWYKIKEKCDEKKIIFLSTPEDELDLELLLDIGIPAK